MSKASDIIRQANIGMVGANAGAIAVPKNVSCRKDMQYGKDPVWNVFDIYYENSNGRRHPTIISIHGGAWVSNTKEYYEKYCLDLAARGFNVVNFTFRLAPENRHPAMIEDVNQLVRHLYEHDAIYGIDMNNVFMVGDSAGGHMLSMYAAICTNPAYAQSFPFTPPRGFIPRIFFQNNSVN